MPGVQAEKLRKLFKSKPLLKLRHAVEYLLILALAWVIPKLRREHVLGLSRWLGSTVMWADDRGRTLGLKNLQLAAAHGGLCLNGRTAEETLRASYQNFARNFLDLFWFTSLTPDGLAQWVEIENEAYLKQLMLSGRGAIFLTPHYGVFEWASLIVGCNGLKLDIIAQDFKNPSLNNIFRKAREHSGHRVLSRNGAMLKLLRSARAGRSIGMLPDLNIPPQGAATAVRIFGIPACVTTMHVEIARRCGMPMYIVVCEPLSDGRARLRLLDVLTASRGADSGSTDQVTQAVWDRFEAAIHQRPELWLWMYRHWHYQPPAGALDAPAQAHEKLADRAA
jgi:Kdo2-lipid IVA lauroyltransferase/acyltransferase